MPSSFPLIHICVRYARTSSIPLRNRWPPYELQASICPFLQPPNPNAELKGPNVLVLLTGTTPGADFRVAEPPVEQPTQAVLAQQGQQISGAYQPGDVWPQAVIQVALQQEGDDELCREVAVADAGEYLEPVMQVIYQVVDGPLGLGAGRPAGHGVAVVDGGFPIICIGRVGMRE